MHFLDNILRTRSHLSAGWTGRWEALLGPRDYESVAKLLELYVPTVQAAAALADLSGYRRHLIPKRSGRPRVIMEPLEPLKAVQAAIARWLVKVAPAHPAAHGFVSGRSPVTHAQ